ncbi:hypothetical protein M6B38_157345 [Iris pallida]|uniref:Uncharacterized protein n=1 Tax=Iris pallida TaxID=29817 RepID=A0AAX6F1J5_IRIPA|nr:hypothetical protein M6B38_157345 [Iris pallida]
MPINQLVYQNVCNLDFTIVILWPLPMGKKRKRERLACKFLMVVDIS